MKALRSSSGSSTANDGMAIFLACVAGMAAVPFGSNRPALWALWALVSALGLIVFSLARDAAQGRSRFDLAAVRLEQCLFLAVAATMLLQLAPLGAVFPLGLTVGASGIAATQSVSLSPDDTWFAFLRWSTYGILFLLTLQAGVRSRRNRFLSVALALVVTAEAIYALVALSVAGDTILIFEKTAYLGMATGTFVNRNSLATFLGIGAVLTLSELLRDRTDRGPQKQREIRILSALALGFIIAALLATQSRMGLAATSLGLLTVLVLRRRALASALKLGFLPVIAMVAVMAYLFGEGVVDRAIFVENAALSRGELYRQVVAMIGNRPWLGFGAGTFPVAFPIFHEPSLSPELVWDYAHSTYLSLWSGLGVVVGSLPLLIVASLCTRMAIAWRRGGAQGRSTRGSAIPTALGATVVVAVHSLVDFSLEIQAVAIAYTITLALGVAEAVGGGNARRSAESD